MVAVNDSAKRKVIPQWMNQKIRREINRRDQAWKRFQSSPSYIREAKYKSIRNRVTKIIRKEKGKFEFLLADKIKEDAKSFYAYVRNKSTGKGKI